MKHRSASLKLSPSVVKGYLEVHHVVAKKPGRGDGSALMDKLASWADKSRQAMVLTCPMGLVGFYEKFGFEFTEIVVPIDAQRLTIMTRLPK